MRDGGDTDAERTRSVFGSCMVIRNQKFLPSFQELCKQKSSKDIVVKRRWRVKKAISKNRKVSYTADRI